jgi:urease accessory protein
MSLTPPPLRSGFVPAQAFGHGGHAGREATRWLVLQLADAAFPTGGFAHSAGLEAAAQLGETRGAQGLDRFARAYLWNVGNASLPFVAAAHDEPAALADLDALVDAMLIGHVANRASRTQGRAFVATCAQVFDSPAIAAHEERARAREGPSHLAPVFGSTLAALGVQRRETLVLYLHIALRGIASAAVRLAVIGPHEAQRLQLRHGPTMDAVLESCQELQPHDAATVAPVVDVVGQTHDTLYARLFQS